MGIVVTIDGPAGAGKSSVALALARRLGFRFLDTGAMYRAVAWATLQAGAEPDDADRLLEIAQSMRLEMTEGAVLVDGHDVTNAIRTPEVTRRTKHAADHPQVRQRLVELQRRFAADKNIVSEGRDQATEVFPHAACKIFLTASDEERARRRVQELVSRGEQVTYDEVLAEQRRRDQEDQSRKIGGLRLADDSIVVETDGLTREQVIDRLERLVRERIGETLDE